jgi:hypothetical protein
MTVTREAFVLPGLFLTVTLLGGFRVDERISLVPPTLAALLLALVMLSTLVRGRVFAPARLMSESRTNAENLSGLVVLLALFAASAQALHLVTPERGLLHGIFVVFLFVQLLTASAAGTDRAGLLRTLLVTLGAAFVLRFIVLEALYAADGGALKRVLTAVLSGVTLGGIEYQPHAPATGYVAFLTLALYMIGLYLLPAAQPPTAKRQLPTPKRQLPTPKRQLPTADPKLPGADRKAPAIAEGQIVDDATDDSV